MIIAVDVDNVLCPMTQRWIEMYNEDCDDAVTIDDITGWELHHFLTKRPSDDSVYAYLQHPDLYKNLEPYPGAVEGVEWLRKDGHDVIFVTACVLGGIDNKLNWLADMGFTSRRNNGRHVGKDVIIANDKWRVNADVLIDDRADTIGKWRAIKSINDSSVNRIGLIYDQPWNRQSFADQYRVWNWKDINAIIDILHWDIPFKCIQFVSSNRIENRDGTISNFCQLCREPAGYHYNNRFARNRNV
jgi:5'(3')-deoxyribonucleotidase